MNLLHVSYGLPSSLSQVDWSEKFYVFLSLYKENLPEPHYLQTELKTWESKGEMFSCTPLSTIADLLPLIDRVTFPNTVIHERTNSTSSPIAVYSSRPRFSRADKGKNRKNSRLDFTLTVSLSRINLNPKLDTHNMLLFSKVDFYR